MEVSRGSASSMSWSTKVVLPVPELPLTRSDRAGGGAAGSRPESSSGPPGSVPEPLGARVEDLLGEQRLEELLLGRVAHREHLARLGRAHAARAEGHDADR